ncbi:PTS fructose transporter subunit IIA [Pediococcus pentosaceus]|uniref:PTS sugar transporter subunit IIA n=1 Tax=Pediococcus pentosaceus TaxID=1255 RepID=UPI002074474E|nr:PTS fructose transporter subunit IIA [Pediococcus pentosaceus]MCM6811004.1 PTS fructose transporter subunit IIA [Pediococcus pentosaceus]
MKIILASHGELAKGMKNTLNMIVGDQANIKAYSAYDEENIDFVSDINKEIQNRNDEELIIVTDVMGGSVNNAMTELVLKNPDVFLVTGMNLPFVLSLATYCSRVDFEAINNLVIEGRKGLINVNEVIQTIKEE